MRNIGELIDFVFFACRMTLHDLPKELLMRIASFLDVESLLALGQTCSRMEDVLNGSLEFKKVKISDENMLKHLRAYGESVRSLDLSHSEFPSQESLKFLDRCIHLRELSLINFEVRHQDLLSYLGQLRELETLSFSMESYSEDDVPSWNLRRFRRRDGSLRKVYAEIGSNLSACEVLVDLLNDCEVIDDVHVNFVGDCDLEREMIVPALEADRWKTLHTFICTSMLGRRQDLQKVFLRSIFADNLSEECSLWIEEVKYCCIYERGLFNCRATPRIFDPQILQESKLIEYYRVVRVSGSTFEPAWGQPDRYMSSHSTVGRLS